MHLYLTKDYAGLSEKTARIIADYIIQKPKSTICLTSGDTPNGVYQAFVQLVKTENVNINDCFFVGLDEWVGMNQHDESSCGNSIFREFIIPLAIPAEKYHFFNAKATDLKNECIQMDAIIANLGGLDIMLVGIGTNGHVGLNEPKTSWKNYAHISDLEEVTKTVGQKYFKSATILSQGITLGLRYFSEAQLPILIANGEKKAQVIQKAIMEEASEDLPASIIQVTSNAIVVVDEAAAAGLRQ